MLTHGPVFAAPKNSLDAAGRFLLSKVAEATKTELIHDDEDE